MKEERLLIDAVAGQLGRITDEKWLRENCRFYAQQVTRGQEEERKRIARELHDESGSIPTSSDAGFRLPHLH